MIRNTDICGALRVATIAAATFLVTSVSVVAQVPVMQSPVLQAPVQAPAVALVRPHSFAPTIALTNATAPAIGRLQTFTFKVSGLKGAKAVHLFRFNPGCGFERQLGVSGLPIRLEPFPRDSRRYTTEDPTAVTKTPNFRDPVGDGLLLDANGEATFQVTGVAGLGGPGDLLAQNRTPDPAALQAPHALEAFARGIATSTGACVPSAAYVFLGADRHWYTLDFDNKLREMNEQPLVDLVARPGQAYTTRPRRAVSVIATKRLAALLAPSMEALAAGSTCKGISTALGQPTYAVGIGEKDGDLTFTMRSGPAGTRCGVIFNRASLPDGVTVTSANFSVETVGTRCQLGNARLPVDLLGSFGLGPFFALGRVSDVVRQPESIVAGTVVPAVTGWIDPFVFPDSGTRLEWQAQFAPMGAVLSCEPTAFNDHAVTLRFDSAEFLVPDGVDLALPLQ